MIAMLPPGIIMKINMLQTLTNFLNMYNQPALMLFREALDNALDIGATRIVIKFRKINGMYCISIEDNGSGMTKKIFEIYLQISESTKQQTGQSIGFAGIGAKIYLARSEDVEILTQTCTGSEAWEATMYRNKKELMHSPITKSSKKTQGTLYKVNINHEDYVWFQNSAEDWCRLFYNEALLNGIKISINGKKIKPWNPITVNKKKFIVKSLGKNFPITLYLLKEKLPSGKKTIEYHICNHYVTNRRFNLLDQVKPEFQDKVFVTIDSFALGNLLKTEKTGFKDGWWKHNADIEDAILKELKKFGVVIDPTQTIPAPKKLSEIIQKVLKDDFPELLQDLGIIVPGPSPGPSPVCPGPSPGPKPRPKCGGKHGGPKQKKGLEITIANRKDKPEEGWIEPQNHKLVINAGHVLYIATGTDKRFYNYHITKVVILTLLQEYNKKHLLTPEELIKKQTDFMTTVQNEGHTWNL